MNKIYYYDTIFSLGPNCMTAMILEDKNMRPFTGPFDWVRGSNFKDKISFFLNDFSDFINKKYLSLCDDMRVDNDKNIYLNSKTNIYFVHDFLKTQSFEENFPLVKEKYLNRISQVTEKLKTCEKVLIVYLEEIIEESDKEIIQIMKELNKKYKPITNGIDILYIRHNENMKNDEFQINRISQNVIIAECFSKDCYNIPFNVKNANNVNKILDIFKLKS